MKINKYEKSGASDMLLALLFTGQFLALAFEGLFKVPGFYFSVFLISCVYGGKKIFAQNYPQVVSSLLLFWIAYFVLFLVSAGLFGYANFLNFLTLFVSQAIVPFFLGRALRVSSSARKINFHLKLIFTSYFFILIYLYTKDPSVFQSDRFYPFLDRSLSGAGGDPTQLFLGYGLSAILLSNYFTVRSKNEHVVDHAISNYLIVFICALLLMLVGSRSSILAVSAVLIGNEFASKVNLKKTFYILTGTFVVVLLGINFVSEERLDLFSELWLVLGVGVNGLACIGSEDGSILYRLSGIFQSLDLFLANPVFGVGAGNYGWLYCGAKGDFIYPHNIVAQIMAELGLVGLFIFCLCIYKTYKINCEVGYFDKSDGLGYANRLFFNLWIFCLLVALFSGNSYDDPLLYLLSGLVSKKPT
jgi:O-antigen ligase